MFILRKITRSGVVTNFSLGDEYTLIDAESAKEEFERTLKDYGFFDQHKDNIRGFVSDYCCSPIALFKNQENYIMTERGHTFENLTIREFVDDRPAKS